MYNIEKKEGYILLDNKTNKKIKFDNWDSLVKYIGDVTEKNKNIFSHICKNFVEIHNSIILDLNVTGKDICYRDERIENPNKNSIIPYIYNTYKDLRRYMVIKETGEGIIVSELLKDVQNYVTLKNQTEDEKLRKWLDKGENAFFYYYKKKKLKYLKSKDITFRREPVIGTGRRHCWNISNNKVKNKVLSNIDSETGKVYTSKYKVGDFDLWYGSRHCDKSWKTSTKCRKQWEKHLPKHISRDENFDYTLNEELDFLKEECI